MVNVTARLITSLLLLFTDTKFSDFATFVFLAATKDFFKSVTKFSDFATFVFSVPLFGSNKRLLQVSYDIMKF